MLDWIHEYSPLWDKTSEKWKVTFHPTTGQVRKKLLRKSLEDLFPILSSRIENTWLISLCRLLVFLGDNKAAQTATVPLLADYRGEDDQFEIVFKCNQCTSSQGIQFI